MFQRAEELQRSGSPNPDDTYLIGKLGHYHVNHLRRVGDPQYARRVAEYNRLELVNGSLSAISTQAICDIAELDADAGLTERARNLFDHAVQQARRISHRPVLIHCLLARGRSTIRIGEFHAARVDLSEALEYAASVGYQILEADIRVAIAWAHLGTGDQSSARTQALYAAHKSEEMGYHWARLDAAEVLAATNTLTRPQF
jgi:tetratricopeptide (TPR) repeat protein